MTNAATGTRQRTLRKAGAAQRAPSKITPPTLLRVFANKRLFARLDVAFLHRVIWVHGPPGAGKTTLVASYLAARGRGPLWYRLDEGDADPATVFLYLATAAAHDDARRDLTRATLPQLGPEHRGALTLFTRHFLRRLFDARPACLVFDDYHEMPHDAPLHESLPHGLEEVPEGSHVVIVSRAPPPTHLARLRLNGVIDVIEPETMRITPEEALALARARDPAASPTRVATIAAATQGWAAGVILMLEAGPTETLPLSGLGVPELLFDYFAGEVLRRMPEPSRLVLAKLALMPTTSANAAVRLTGSDAAADLLEDLRKRNYFTVRDGDAEPHYRFHPLFREFLLDQAQRLIPPDKLSALRVSAAGILDADDQPDAAASLLAEAGAFTQLGDLFRRRAAKLLDESRFGTLSRWLALLPVELIDGNGWLSYYAGETLLWNGKPEAAIPPFMRAFDLFTAAGDTASRYLAWAGQGDALRNNGFGDQTRWDALIRAFRAMQAEHPDIPAGRTTERVAFVMAVGLSRRGNAREEIEAWQQRALDAAREARRPGGLELCHSMFLVSDIHDARFPQALRHLEHIADPFALDHVPSTQVCAVLAHASMILNRQITSDYAEFVEAAIARTDSAGWAIWTYLLAGMAVTDAYQRGDAVRSAAWLERLAVCAPLTAEGRGSYYHFAAAQHHLLTGDLALARTHADEAVKIAARAGWAYMEGVARATRCNVLLSTEALDDAHAELLRLDDLLAGSATAGIAPAAGYIRSQLLFDRGDSEAGTAALRAALALGRRQGGWRIVAGGSTKIPALLARALREGIEPDYVRDMIRRTGIPSPDPYDEAWPWPIRITTLGGFSVTIDGAPLTFSRKLPKRLIALLKAIAAFGGRAVPEQKLADALWPDDEGDAARSALTIAIHRLRKLLGDAAAIVVSGGTVGLDPWRCWLDLWTFEHLLSPIPDESGATLPRCERLFALYRGDFLASDNDLPWARPPRERLRSRFARMVEMRAGLHDDTIAIFERGIEAAPEAEALYQGLMRHHLGCGRTEAGLAVYARLRRMLGGDLEAEPAPFTQALLERLRAVD